MLTEAAESAELAEESEEEASSGSDMVMGLGLGRAGGASPTLCRKRSDMSDKASWF